MKKIFTYVMMLTLTMGALTSCENDDQYLADQLRNRDWQGYIGAYYQDRWGITGSEYATVMRFRSNDAWATSGRGEELDYCVNSPRYDYAYATFKWFIVDGEITLLYDDDVWRPIYIIDYGLNSMEFYGYIYDGTNRRIRFDLQSSDYADWSYYRRSGYGGYGYGDFEHQNYYRARENALFDGVEQPTDSVLIINRTEEVRQQTGINDAYSVASGVFAKRYKEMMNK